MCPLRAELATPTGVTTKPYSHPMDTMPRSLKLLFRFHALAYRTSGGLVGHCLTPSMRCLLLTTTGARTGRQRLSPLLYGRDGDRVVLIASQGGTTKNPPWYHNLLAHPTVEVQMGRTHSTMRATEVTGKERERLWRVMTRIYRGYEGYQRATERTIPVIVLSPVRRSATAPR